MGFKTASRKAQSTVTRPTPKRVWKFSGEAITVSEYVHLLKQQLQKIEQVLADKTISKEMRDKYSGHKSSRIQELKFARGEALQENQRGRIPTQPEVFRKIAAEVLDKETYKMICLRVEHELKRLRERASEARG